MIIGSNGMPQPVTQPIHVQINPQVSPQKQQFPGFTTIQVRESSIYDGMVKDEKGRYMIKSGFNWTAWTFFFTGIMMLPLLVGIFFLLWAFFAKNIDFIFDEELRELTVHTYGGLFKFQCLEAELTISFDRIKDIEVKADYTQKLNGQPNGIMYLVTTDGQKVQLTRGFNAYLTAVASKNRILAIARKNRPTTH